ncbi:MAG TPA: Gfo/Idh/MocA family oxidoreductase [Steroidobacteraceae bacterium]|nr:Gfo/Idh/MocA family oxidoreductase [Steroidobacteraceae bacterium]
MTSVVRAATGKLIRTALVGLGWVGANRHLPQILRNPDFQLVGVVDRRPGRAREFAAGRPEVRAVEASDLSGIAWISDVDAVIVSTAPTAHHNLVLAALAQGKHVLVEKPLAMTVADGDSMVAAARDAGRILAVVHNFQFSAAMRALLSDVESGRLGKVRSVAGVQLGNPSRRLPTWYDDLPLGLFYDESPHLLYLLDRLAGGSLDVRHVASIPSTTSHRTPAQLHVTLFAGDDPRPFTVHCNFEAAISEWYLLVHGEHAIGIADIFRDIYLRLPNDGAHTPWPVLRTSLVASWQHWRQVLSQGVRHVAGRMYYGNDEVYRRFADAILRDPSRIDPIGPERARRVLRLQHEIILRSR